VADDLHETAVVAQVEEDEATVVAATVHPASKAHTLARVLRAQLPATVAL
jgi:hypothetical protein